MSLNKVMLIGNVGQNPDVRYLDNQQAKVASFRMATTERYTDRSGQSKEETEWHNIVVWRRNADVVEKYVTKGTQLYVEGRLRTREWTDNTGNKRYTTEIVADNIQLLGKRSDNPAGAGMPSQGGYSAPAQKNYQAPYQPSQAAAPAAPAQGPSVIGGYQAPYQPGQTAATSAGMDNADDGSDDLPF